MKRDYFTVTYDANEMFKYHFLPLKSRLSESLSKTA